MKTVEMVELVLENGESYDFNVGDCMVELNDITNNIICLGGETFHNKTANDVKVCISSYRDEDGLFDNLIEQNNILQVSLHNEHECEVYNVKWGEGDVDENSYQRSSISLVGDLNISINEENTK